MGYTPFAEASYCPECYLVQNSPVGDPAVVHSGRRGACPGSSMPTISADEKSARCVATTAALLRRVRDNNQTNKED